MSATKILWGQIIIVFAIVLLAIWSATEWTAWRLGFQPQLGHPWFELLHFPFYLPPAFFWWWYAYDAYAPDIFIEGAYIAASGGFIAAAVAIGMSVWRAREAKNAETYGSARWAQPKEIEAAGLLRTRWRRAGPLPAQLSAPRRTGACAVLRADAIGQGRRPRRPDAADLAGLGDRPRHQGRELAADRRLPRRSTAACCCSIRPTRSQSAYNPLLEVRRGEWEVRDVQNIADILVDPEGSLERRNHWEKTSHALLVGAILHVLYAEADKTLAGVAVFLSDPKRPIESTLSAMMTTPHLGEAGVIPSSPPPRASCSTSPSNERSGVLSHRHVVPRPLSRSGGRRGDAALRLAHRAISSTASGRRRSTSSCRPPTSAAPSR